MITQLLMGWLTTKLIDSLLSHSPYSPGASTTPGYTPRRRPITVHHTTWHPSYHAAVHHARRVKQHHAAPHHTTTIPPVVVRASAPAWPQTVPSGLPPFPGSGWIPDVPLDPGVATRAASLLVPLWRSGAGTFKVEQTQGRWIAYRATPMGSKRGVVAYKLALPREGAVVAPHTASPHVVTPARAIGLPTLRRGSRGKDVQILQHRLGITADGIFGPGTERSVRAFQSSHRLAVDGIVGRNTWAALLGQGVMA